MAVGEDLRNCRDKKFHMFPLFKILQENNLLRKSYEDYFIDQFKPLLSKKSLIAKPIPRQRQIKWQPVYTFEKTAPAKPVFSNLVLVVRRCNFFITNV